MRSDLDPFYERAHAIFRLGPYVYDERAWHLIGKKPLAFDPKRFVTIFKQQSEPLRFGSAYRAELERAKNVRVVLNANVTHIETNQTASAVTQLKLRTIQGKEARARAQRFVLACGGIENARLLLLSNQVEKAGLGNRYDNVGRYFTDHVGVHCGAVFPTRTNQILGDAAKWSPHKGIPFWPTFAPNPEVQAAEHLLNFAGGFQTLPAPESGSAAMKNIWRDLQNGKWSDDLGAKVWRVVTDFDNMVANAYRRKIRGIRDDEWTGGTIFTLFSDLELLPNPDSRVSLSGKRDAFGLNQARVDLRRTDQDKKTALYATRMIAAELGRLKLGRFRMAEWLRDGGKSWPEIEYANHHVGTTRMSDDAKLGVVDRNCRMHSIGNFYVAGSSVFVTEGSANPTITIVALALRLSDHLKARLE